MITKELAVTLRVGQELWHSFLTGADDKPIRCRVNGKCKTWVRTPAKWKLPVKYGLKNCFYIAEGTHPQTEQASWRWSLPERWEIERHYRP
jgi:hypothetical protein